MDSPKTPTTLAALKAQIAKLQAQADAIAAKERAEVINRIRVAIEHYGLTAAELGLGVQPTKRRQAGAKPGAAKTAAAPATPKPAKFVDGTGNTWSGLGKRPNWFKAALAAGKKPADLLVKRGR